MAEAKSAQDAAWEAARQSIEPNPDGLRAFLKADADAPVVMLNLLAFYPEARYPAGSKHSPCTGREAYMKYAAYAEKKVASLGGKMLFMGDCSDTLIGGEAWDVTALVLYPSRKAFLTMAASVENEPEAREHRIAGLARTKLIPCSERQG